MFKAGVESWTAGFFVWALTHKSKPRGEHQAAHLLDRQDHVKIFKKRNGDAIELFKTTKAIVALDEVRLEDNVDLFLRNLLRVWKASVMLMSTVHSVANYTHRKHGGSTNPLANSRSGNPHDWVFVMKNLPPPVGLRADLVPEKYRQLLTSRPLFSQRLQKALQPRLGLDPDLFQVLRQINTEITSLKQGYTNDYFTGQLGSLLAEFYARDEGVYCLCTLFDVFSIPLFRSLRSCVCQSLLFFYAPYPSVLSLLSCVCVCVCVLIVEKGRKMQKKEREREKKIVCVCVCVCVCAYRDVVIFWQAHLFSRVHTWQRRRMTMKRMLRELRQVNTRLQQRPVCHVGGVRAKRAICLH